jgi:ankyrin repeat protein
VHLLLRDHAASATLLPWVMLLMAGGVTADTPNGAGVPLLCSAAAAGNSTVVKWLLDSSADATATDTTGRNALHYAAKGSIHQVETLRETYDMTFHLGDGASSLLRRSSTATVMARLSTNGDQNGASKTVANGRRKTADDARKPGQVAGTSLLQALRNLSSAYARTIDLLLVCAPECNL